MRGSPRGAGPTSGSSHGPVRGSSATWPTSGGGTINFSDASTDLFDCLNTRYAKGTKIDVTLTPTGPLIDGSKGKILRYQFPVEKLNLASWGFGSVPIGAYKATVTATTPDGKKKALKIGRNMADLHETIEFSWSGSGYENEILELMQLYIGG